MQPKHIVIVEDHPEILEVQELLLTEAGYRVTAMQAVTSLDALLELGADCFILDEQLPNVSGHIICIYLRSKAQTSHIPVILVSAHPRVSDYAILCNADAHIMKPFNNIHFLTEIELLVNPGKKQYRA